MKKLLAVLLAAVMVVSMAACGGTKTTTAAATTKAAEQTTKAAEATTAAATTEAKKEPVTISYWDENGGDERTPYFEELKKRFEEKYDWITIDYVPLVQSEALSKYLVAMETGTTPDTAGFNGNMQNSVAAAGHLVDLTEMVKAWDEYEDLNSQIYENLNMHYDGKHLFLPRSGNINVLWYNKTIVDEAGLSNPYDWTWKDWFASLEKLNHPDKDQYATIIRGGSGGAVELYAYIYDYLGVGEQIGEDGYSTVYSEDTVDFVSRYLGNYKKYTNESDITADYKNMTATFDSCAGAMLLHNLGSFPNHTKAFAELGMEFGAAPLPMSDYTGKTVDWAGALAHGMFDTCENQEEAFLWLAYLSSHEGNGYFCSSIGELPINNACANDAWLDEQFHIKMAMELATSDRFLEVETIGAWVPNWGTLCKTWEQNLSGVLSGEMTADEYVKQMKADIDANIDVYNAQ